MFFEPNKPKLLLALDIGATSVRGVVFWAHKDGKPEVAGVFNADTKVGEKATFDILEKNIFGAVRAVMGRVAKSAPARLDGVFVSLSSPWYFSETRVLSAERRESFAVTRDFVASIVKEEEGRVLADAAKKFSVRAEDLVILENHHMKSYLNGYAVRGIYNKSAKTFNAHVYMSVGLRAVTNDVAQAAKEILNVSKVHIHSAPHIMFSVLREAFDAESGFLSVEIGEEITDIMFVRDGFIEEAASFARGGNFIVRRIASFMKIPPEEAAAHFRMFSDGMLDEKEAARIGRVVKESSAEWLALFTKVLEHFRAIAGVPERAFVFGGAPVIKSFADAATSQSLARFTVTSSPISVNILVPEALREGFFQKAGLKTHKETIAAFLVLFFNKHVWEKTEN